MWKGRWQLDGLRKKKEGKKKKKISQKSGLKAVEEHEKEKEGTDL